MPARAGGPEQPLRVQSLAAIRLEATVTARLVPGLIRYTTTSLLLRRTSSEVCEDGGEQALIPKLGLEVTKL